MATVVQWKVYAFCKKKELGLNTNFTAQQLGGAGREEFSPNFNCCISKSGILIFNSAIVVRSGG